MIIYLCLRNDSHILRQIRGRSPADTKFAVEGRTLNRVLYYPIRVDFNSNDPGEVAMLIADLREEHRDLDQAIARLVEDPSVDQLRLTRLKKRKLKLKDWIAYLESKLIPDLDA